MHTQRRSELLLASVIIARSSSYLCSKTALGSVTPFTLLSLRFSLAFVLLLVLFWKRLVGISMKTVLRGALLGASFFAMLTAEMFALRTTQSSTAALLENMAIVFVPVFSAVIYKKRMTKDTAAGALIAFLGAVLVILRNGRPELGGGVPLCILAAVLYAVSILLTSRESQKDDPLTLGILQVGFMALFSNAAALASGTYTIPHSPGVWGCILILAVVCSCFGYTLQPVAQKGTTPERAGLFCALNPAVAAVLGWAIRGENLGALGVLGAAVILCGILASNYLSRHSGPRIRRSGGARLSSAH